MGKTVFLLNTVNFYIAFICCFLMSFKSSMSSIILSTRSDSKMVILRYESFHYNCILSNFPWSFNRFFYAYLAGELFDAFRFVTTVFFEKWAFYYSIIPFCMSVDAFHRLSDNNITALALLLSSIPQESIFESAFFIGD